MPSRLDLVGQKFGRLTVLEERGRSKDGCCKWLCKCDCGNYEVISTGSLRSGNSKSCGCYFKESVAERFTKHGHSPATKVSPEYSCWAKMNNRCSDPNHKYFKYYGGRGIKVCERWKGENGFANFLLDMGARPSLKHTVDRYPNQDGDYEPSNCRWATIYEQKRNMRNNHWVEYNGKEMIVADWVKELNISDTKIRYHLGKGLSMEEIVKKFKTKTENATNNR